MNPRTEEEKNNFDFVVLSLRNKEGGALNIISSFDEASSKRKIEVATLIQREARMEVESPCTLVLLHGSKQCPQQDKKDARKECLKRSKEHLKAATHRASNMNRLRLQQAIQVPPTLSHPVSNSKDVDLLALPTLRRARRESYARRRWRAEDVELRDFGLDAVDDASCSGDDGLA